MSKKIAFKKKAKGWLNSHGYPFEMRIAKIFAKLKYNIKQSSYYTDPFTGKTRELDLVATKFHNSELKNIKFSFFVECKTSKEDPWVIFTSTHNHPNSPGMNVLVQPHTNNLNSFFWSIRSDVDFKSGIELFRIDYNAGHSIVQAGNKGKDSAYEAINQVINATKANLDKEEGSDIGTRTIALPIVVTDAKLFTCELNSKNEITLNEVKMHTLVWYNDILDTSFTIIKIINEDKLGEFLGDVDNEIDNLFNAHDEFLRNEQINKST